MPGAMVVAQRADDHVLLTRRGDDGTWCLPGGAAEVGGSFVTTAKAELLEEVGLTAELSDLVAFGTLSEARHQTVEYPNGDVTHCFAVLFVLRRWHGTPSPDGEEAVEARFVAPDQLPEPVKAPSLEAVRLFRNYVSTGNFQVG